MYSYLDGSAREGVGEPPHDPCDGQALEAPVVAGPPGLLAAESASRPLEAAVLLHHPRLLAPALPPLRLPAGHPLLVLLGGAVSFLYH